MGQRSPKINETKQTPPTPAASYFNTTHKNTPRRAPSISVLPLCPRETEILLYLYCSIFFLPRGGPVVPKRCPTFTGNTARRKIERRLQIAHVPLLQEYYGFIFTDAAFNLGTVRRGRPGFPRERRRRCGSDAGGTRRGNR